MSNSPGVEPVGIVGISLCAMSAALEWLDVHSGAIVALCSIIGAICAIVGAYRGHRKDKDEWVDTIVKKPKKKNPNRLG